MDFRYDILDDLEIEDTQTSASDLISSDGRPMDDFTYIVDIHSGPETDIEDIVDRLKAIMSSCVEEFSAIDAELHIRFGFDNTFLSPKSIYRFVNYLLLLNDLHSEIVIKKSDDIVFSLDYYDGWMDTMYYTLKITKFGFELFPFLKYGFKAYDDLLKIPESKRLEKIANTHKVVFSGMHHGTLDLSFINDDEYGYYIKRFEFEEDVPKPRLDDYGYILKNGLSKIENPCYQFGHSRGGLYLDFDIFLGPLYVKKKKFNNAFDVILRCVFMNNGIDEDLPYYLKRIDKIFGGRMPDELKKTIEKTIKTIKPEPYNFL